MSGLQEKKARLVEILQEMGSLVVAFSGGVDSSLLLAVAAKLYNVKLMAVTITSVSFSEQEKKDAEAMIHRLGVYHRYVEVDQMSLPEFVSNTPDRCYYCKKEIFSIIRKMADAEGFTYVVDGGNVDDQCDFRPGRRALKELGVRSPMEEAGLTKRDIREISREMGLFTAAKPSSACLASRIPYGETITPEKLMQVEKAEEILRTLGFTQVRVRYHGTLARIEVDPAQIVLLAQPSTRARLTKLYKDIGFKYVCADLEGFRSGSMNEELDK